MLNCFIEHTATSTVPIIPLTETEYLTWKNTQPNAIQNWLNTLGFKAKLGAHALLSNSAGGLESVIVGMGSDQNLSAFGQVATKLPAGEYHIQADYTEEALYQAYLFWGLGTYQFTRYKTQQPAGAKLKLPAEGLDEPYLMAMLKAIYLVRNLINTPASDMGPADIAEVANQLAHEFGADLRFTVGEQLLEENYPAIYAVGKGSARPPQLIDLRWGNSDDPKVTLVGKGVCFDTGGLNLKNAAGMALMKKDMAGAAHVLGLAYFILSLRLPIQLRVLIPAVENSVSGDAYRPGDILNTRAGLTVEVTNTDAEGRLVLCDALAEAVTENPELILDFASLTGAARVALGTDLGALFTDQQDLAEQLIAAGEKERDMLWRLPLYSPYKKLIDSKIADLSNAASAPYGGAITAALFLKAFVPDTQPWAHFDIMAWNTTTGALGPEGGDATALRAVARYLHLRFR
ncbi:MAG: leucyl aminopeptidase family protein [Gammaproteobacteria bacterium]